MSLHRSDATIPVQSQGEALSHLDAHLPEKVDKNKKKKPINKQPPKKKKGKKMKAK